MLARLPIRTGGIVRLLLIAFWAVTATLAPAHATIDDFADPCLQIAAASDETSGAPADADQKFHADHGCKTCHAHAFPMPIAQPSAAPTPAALSRVFADAQADASSRADGPYRPPQA